TAGSAQRSVAGSAREILGVGLRSPRLRASCRSWPRPWRARRRELDGGSVCRQLAAGRAHCAWPDKWRYSTARCREGCRRCRIELLVNACPLLLAQGLDHVVDVDVGFQLVAFAQRVVGQANDVLDLQAGLAAPGAQFGRADEFLEVMGAARNHLEDVLGADN